MKKRNIIIGCAVIVVIIVVAVVFALNRSNNSSKTSGNVDLSTVESTESFLDKVYENMEDLPRLATSEIDLTNTDSLSYYTGLTDSKDIEFALASEPLMSSQAYSFVIVKVSDGANVDKIKQDIFDKVNIRKWICVEADQKFAINYDNTILFVMSNEGWAGKVFDKVKELLGKSAGTELAEDNYVQNQEDQGFQDFEGQPVENSDELVQNFEEQSVENDNEIVQNSNEQLVNTQDELVQ